MPEFQLIGSVSGPACFTAREIAAALDGEPTALQHGATFTGRPGTQVYVLGGGVLKLRTEIVSADATRWACAAVERERTLRVHHPAKTWFVVAGAGGSSGPVAGNICPLLVPLHVAWRAAPDSGAALQLRFEQLGALLQRHFQARACGSDLDLGLSNFGLDRSGDLFYLDDDVYPAHAEHTALGHMLAVYLRGQDWIDATMASEIGRLVAARLAGEAGSTTAAASLVELLAQLYTPDGRAKQALEALIDALRSAACAASTHSRSAAPSAQREQQIALVSDIHANLPALDAALEFIEFLGVPEVVVLGDVVGYGPHPAECVERLAATSFRCIKGNHDYACALTGSEEPSHPVAMSRDARWVADWTAARLSDAHRRWLRELPTALEGEGWLAVHGSPIDPNRFNGYVYEMTYERNLDELHRLGLKLCFHGHTHVRGVFARVRGRADAFYAAELQALHRYAHALVCPGSIGQPRNGMPGAQLAVYDRGSCVIQFYSIAYAMERTIADMQRHGFPSALSQRLRSAT
jgi:predicted phosphodiesterase